MGVEEQFEKAFGYPPPSKASLVSAPGRVNLIGEHIDYNGGRVMPIAISRHTEVLVAPSLKPKIRVFSELYSEEIQWDVKNRERISSPSWGNYVKGVFVQLFKKGLIKKGDFDKEFGFDIFISSDIPAGTGLSSSAALEIACAYAMLLHTACQLVYSDEKGAHFEIAKLCMMAEHEFAQVQCGLMDQVSAIFSRKNEVIVFDTHLNTIRFIPFFEDCIIAIVDSGQRRKLSDSRYNDRRRESGEALQKIQKIFGEKEAQSWRKISLGHLAESVVSLPPPLRQRALHIVSEMERVKKAFLALQCGDKEYFGRLMNESHESLRLNFEVSLPEIDLLQDIAVKLPGVYGARLCGAGFGGSVIALIQEGEENRFEGEIKRRYKTLTGKESSVIFVRPSSGVIELLNQVQKQQK